MRYLYLRRYMDATWYTSKMAAVTTLDSFTPCMVPDRPIYCSERPCNNNVNWRDNNHRI